MRFFDLHCDTITNCGTDNIPLYDSDNHISVKKAAALDAWVQVFAIWMPDEHRGLDAIEYFDRIYKTFTDEINRNAEYMAFCKSAGDIRKALDNKKAAAVLSVEGGSALAGDIDRLEKLYDAGVRLMTITWNGENELACGCVTGSENGLKPLGRDVVKLMNKMGMIVDVSHLNRGGFWDLAKTVEKPFVASHSTSADILRKHRNPSEDADRSIARNLDDEQIKYIIKTGGIIGINLCDSFLGDPGDDGCEAVFRHAAHILDMGGEKVIAMGSDFDGCDINPEMDSIDKMPALYDYLSGRGIDRKTLDAMFFDNAYRFFKNNI